MNNQPILIFDSGIGSYSVVKEIVKVLPHENIIYLADRNSFPYGLKTKSELMENMLEVIHFFEKNYNPKIILIASNTPSIQVLDDIKSIIKTPVSGVFPPINKAANISRNKCIAILATKSAVESKEIDDYIQKELSEIKCRVVKVNASPMVGLIEPGTFLTNQDECIRVCKSVIDPFLNSGIDVITLSSTHLPFLNKYIKQLYPEITLLDPAEDISIEIKSYLHNNDLLSNSHGSIQVLGTENESKKLYNKDLEQIFHTMGFKCSVESIEIK